MSDETVGNRPLSWGELPVRRRVKLGNPGKGQFPDDMWDQWSEQFRGLRTRIDYQLTDHAHKIVLVTSAIPKEGKTTTAVNLARSITTPGVHTLLIDCDMRRPTLHALFDVPLRRGVRELLREGGPPGECVIETDINGMDLLLAGNPDGSPAELFVSNQVPTLLEKLRESYDYIVLDSPPVLPVTDAVLLSQWTDGVLLVAESSRTPREVVMEAVKQLKDRSRILGVVLNGIEATKRYHSYYGYY